MSQEHNDTYNESAISKLDALILNNGWNDKNEVLIVSIGENAASFKWMHEKCGYRYSLYNKIINIIIIFFNSLLSAQSLVPVDSSSYPVINILQNVLIYIVTLLSVTSNFLKYEELSTKHLNASSLFSDLYHDVQQQMCLYRKDRLIAVKYISDTLKKYDSLVSSSPDISKSVLLQFKKQYKNTDISIPDIADKIQKIEIITQPSEMNPNVSYNQTDTSSVAQECSIYNISGDILDSEVESLGDILRKKAMKAQTAYEYERYRSI